MSKIITRNCRNRQSEPFFLGKFLILLQDLDKILLAKKIRRKFGKAVEINSKNLDIRKFLVCRPPILVDDNCHPPMRIQYRGYTNQLSQIQTKKTHTKKNQRQRNSSLTTYHLTKMSNEQFVRSDNDMNTIILRWNFQQFILLHHTGDHGDNYDPPKRLQFRGYTQIKLPYSHQNSRPFNFCASSLREVKGSKFALYECAKIKEKKKCHK